MASAESIATLDDLEAVSWQDVLEEAREKECWQYCSLFCARASDAESAGDARALRVYIFLARITSLIFKLDSKDAPLDGGATLAGFSDTELSVMATFEPTIADPELRARVADILWLCQRDELRKRNHLNGRRAVMSYLESAKRSEDPEKWVHCADRVERALQIAATLGRTAKNEQYMLTISYIEEVLDRYHGDDPLFLSAKMMELVQQQGCGDPAKYAAFAAKAAEQHEAAHEWDRARTYWRTAARWHELNGKDQERRDARIREAETYVQEGEDRIAGASPSFLVASHHYQSAIVALRHVGGMKERIRQLHRTLLDYQERSVSELQVFTSSAEENIEDIVKRVRERVQQGTLHDALLALAFIGPVPKVSDLEELVKEFSRSSPMLDIFPITLLNERGRQVARTQSMSSTEPDTARTGLEAAMFKNALYTRQRLILLLEETARQQINFDHNVRIADFFPFVSNNPFIPEGHEFLYARGLHAGLTGDFMVAAHLLIPQLENSVRYVLEKHGAIVSGLDDDRVQDEHSLNTTLLLPEAIRLFGENMVFDLRGLLIERHGSNLRNLLAHGLLKDGMFQTSEVIYCWWIALRLCCISFVQRLSESADEVTEQGDPGNE